MGGAIAEVLALGVGVTLSPLAIIAVVLMLSGQHGRRKAAAFVAAWVLGLAVVATLVVLVADVAEAGADGAPADWVGIVKIAVAVLLLVVAARQWRARPARDEVPELPAWTTRLERITPLKAGGLAVALASVKPKNLLLTVAAAVAVAQTGASPGRQAIALAVFVLLGTLGPALPLAIAVLMRDRGPDILAVLRDWLVRENATIIVILCVVLAAKLAGDAITTLTG